MKKIMALFCALTMLFSFTACCGNSDMERVSDEKADDTLEAETESNGTEPGAPDNSKDESDASSPEEHTSPTVNPPQQSESSAGTEKVPDTEKPVVKPPAPTETPAPETASSVPQETMPETKPEPVPEPPVTEEEEKVDTIRLFIGEKELTVEWEDNESVNALKELVKEHTLAIQMSMYGGFEQVGALGSRLPQNDVQTTTSAGDIVLYSGNQIVMFYGSNSWAYTRLGRVSNMSADEMAELLGNGDIGITLMPAE